MREEFDENAAALLSGSVTVSDLLSKYPRLENVQTIKPTENLHVAGKKMADQSIGALIVSDEDGKVLGIVTERDFMRSTLERGDAKKIIVKEVMTPVESMYCAKPSDKVEKGMRLMSAHKFRHLPVIDDNSRLCGILSIKDMVQSVIEGTQTQLERMTKFIQTWIKNQRAAKDRAKARQ